MHFKLSYCSEEIDVIYQNQVKHLFCLELITYSIKAKKAEMNDISNISKGKTAN